MATIVLWNTVYLERVVQALREQDQVLDEGLQQYLSPMEWEHINLTGDYSWRPTVGSQPDTYRPLQSVSA